MERIQQSVSDMGVSAAASNDINPDRLFPEIVTNNPPPALPHLLHQRSRLPPSGEGLQDSPAISSTANSSSENDQAARYVPLTETARQIQKETQEHQEGQRGVMKKKHDGKRRVVTFVIGDFASIALPASDRTALDSDANRAVH